MMCIALLLCISTDDVCVVTGDRSDVSVVTSNDSVVAGAIGVAIGAVSLVTSCAIGIVCVVTDSGSVLEDGSPNAV